MTDPAAIVRSADWLAHRYDPEQDAVQFRRVPRAVHRSVTFIIDDNLPPGAPMVALRRTDALALRSPTAPLHFIFHSAFCCSTLLARAMDREGVAMGLKEPVILNDIVGWRKRGAEPGPLGAALEAALTLLARPFARDEAVVVKPSNIVNPLAPAILAMRPKTHALLLHAPLRTYLASIAKKGLDGRLWVRTLFASLYQAGIVDFAFDRDQYFGQTDLQIAAVGWLAQQQLFVRLVARFGPERVRTLNSETLTADPAASVAALAAHFGLALDDRTVAAIVAGPAFTRHSKSGDAFGRDARDAETRDALAAHADELDKVARWAEVVADGAGIPMTLAAPLVRG